MQRADRGGRGAGIYILEMRTRRALLALAPALVVFGCGNGGDGGGGGDPTQDAAPDGSSPDVVDLDSGVDTALPDTTAIDTAPVDVGTPIDAGDPGASDVTLSVRSDLGVHAISPWIYGQNELKNTATARPAMVRQGGNRLTAWNWENNASNAGSDFNFQNDNFLGGGTTPGEVVRAFVQSAIDANATAYVTVPIVDYVAADTSPAGDVRSGGSGYLSTRFKQNKATKGSAFADPPVTTDAFVYQDEMVAWLKKRFPSQTIVFAMDNEPDLWSATHAEVHPSAVKYDELVTRTTTYATAVKAVWPTALVSGFVSYGWEGYTTLQSAPDAAGKGEFWDYFLTKMKAAEATAGKRLVDYLDLHYYSEATGGGTRVTDVQNATAADARVQAPRSLWDPAYKETSWIANDVLGGPLKLVPRVKAKIAAGYPGTKLAFSEWHFGGGSDISGGVAAADALGVFGREGVELATFWPMGSDAFYYGALQCFRNYDGAGARFGDTSISGTSSDESMASVYASVDAADPNRVVLVVVNKSASGKRAGITVGHPQTFKHAKVWVMQGATAKPVAAADLATVATNAYAYAMPPRSVSILVPTP